MGGCRLEWFSSFFIVNLIGISANLDNTGAGMAYGINNFRIPTWFNMIINLIGFFYALVGVYLGSVISQVISPAETGLVSFCVFFCIGIVTIYNHYSSLLLGKNKSETKIKQARLRDAIILGFALSFTNIAAGIGTAVAYEALIWPLVISITIWGYISIWIGNVIGKNLFSNMLGRYSSLVAGLIFIAIGLNQLL